MNVLGGCDFAYLLEAIGMDIDINLISFFEDTLMVYYQLHHYTRRKKTQHATVEVEMT